MRDFEPINVKVDGAPTVLYIATPDSDWFTGGGGDEFVVPQSGRAYLSTTNYTDPETYFKPSLLGGSVEFDADISQDACGCVAAFYTVSMPARNSDGSYNPGEKGQYYCDANMVGGTYCPEFDLMEANTKAFQATPHSCDAPDEHGFYSNCDRSGECYQNSVEKLDPMAFGPGSSYTINTMEIIHVRTDFNMDDASEFSSFTTTISQNGNSVQLQGECESNSKMSGDLKEGMVFALSNWYGGEPWLDKGICGGVNECSNPTLTFTNMEFNQGPYGKSYAQNGTELLSY